MAQKKITDLSLRTNFDETVNLPGDDTAQTWRVTGQQILDFIRTNVTSPNQTLNLGLAALVSANALTISVKQADGSTNPSSSSPVKVGFRSSTLTSGAYNIRSITGALSITVPASATLGHVSGLNQYVWVYLLDNAGTPELAVSGVQLFDDLSYQSTTTISSGSTSGTVLYSATGRSNVPIRLIGRILVNQATAGTWATAPAEVALVSGKQPVTSTEWTSYTPTYTAFGTPSSAEAFYKRIGDSLWLRGRFVGGTATGSTASISFPSGLSLDTTKETLASAIYGIGTNGGSATVFSVIAGSTPGNNVQFGRITNAASLAGAIGTDIVSGGTFSWYAYGIPVLGWSNYGP